MMMNNWRLILTNSAKGVWNMAVDEALLESVIQNESLPILRLYAWETPCVSLGYAQPVSDINLIGLKERGWDIVRRPTGGRAVLHADELTYSVIGPKNEPHLAGGIVDSYLVISKALLEGLQTLGVDANADAKYDYLENNSGLLKQTSNQKKMDPVCFEVPSNYEITVNGKKLVGSAQARKRGGVLQHGTIPLDGDISRILQILKFEDSGSKENAKEKLFAHATTLEGVLGYKVSWNVAAETLEEAFGKVLNISFIHSELTEKENERADQLVKEKYANNTWLKRI
jgi:lipoate-protein ligase A